ncbi:MAG: hypothetical protein L6Q69_12395 [Zoogloea sp.]|nr:hypothetical protein [Zoogloea sp.]
MKHLLIATSLSLLALSAQAVDIAVPAAEVHARVQQPNQNLLFVDVRDPVEIMFVGFTDAVHVNVPFLMVDRTAWDEKRGVYKLVQNPEFVSQIKAELERRGLGMDAEVITLCRSGSERGEPSASFLRSNGFPGHADQRGPPGRTAAGQRLAEQWPSLEHEDEPRQDVPYRQALKPCRGVTHPASPPRRLFSLLNRESRAGIFRHCGHIPKLAHPARPTTGRHAVYSRDSQCSSPPVSS